MEHLSEKFGHYCDSVMLIGSLSKDHAGNTMPTRAKMIPYLPHFLRTRLHSNIPTGTLCDLIRMILTMNNFSFNDNHYLQIHGTAMGTKMAPSFANPFLGHFEANALKNAPFHPHTWYRYSDDIFIRGTQRQVSLKSFETQF